MADAGFEVIVSAGDLRPNESGHLVMPHRWTAEGVAIVAEFTGAHLLHLAAAGCVLNDVYREAAALGVAIDGVRVRATGGFDTTTWSSTGVDYEVEVSSPASPADIERLLEVVDAVAEIPRALRQGTTVSRR